MARGGDPASGTQPASAQTVESTLAAGTLAPSLSKRSALAPTGREPAGTGVVTFPTGLPEEDPSAAAQQAVQPLPGRGGPAVPVADSRPRRGRQVPQASVADKARVPSGVGAKTPLICVPVALPLPAIVPLNLKPVGGAGGESPERGRKAIACDVAAGQPIAPADTVLEVRLKTKGEPKTDVSPVNSAPPVKTEAGKPENVVNTNATASSDKTSSHEKPDSRAAQASNALQPIRSAAEPERAILSATAQQPASVP
ncbi:MAG: hypothetical protein KGN84_02300, partial [Acidobacteriota bacterium]|nr:hypothetical protein [Acidobacteriota bacterium]